MKRTLVLSAVAVLLLSAVSVFVFLIFFLIMLTACDSRHQNNIPTTIVDYANLNVYPWEDFVQSAEKNQVRLRVKGQETSISSIEKVLFHDGCIFALDVMERKVIKYDMSGEPIATLQRIGRGPGEYIHLDDFCLDSDGNLYALDCSTSVLNKYDFSFKYLESFRLDFAADQISRLTDSCFVFSLSPFNGGRYEDVELLYTAADFTQTEPLAYYDSPVSLDEVISLPLLTNSDCGLLYHRTVTDYAYRIDSLVNISSVSFDFGNEMVPYELRENLCENLKHYSSYTTLLQCYAISESKIFGMLYRYGKEHLFVLDRLSSAIFLTEVVNPFYSYGNEGSVDVAEYPLGASASYFITCSRAAETDCGEEYVLNLYPLR